MQTHRTLFGLFAALMTTAVVLCGAHAKDVTLAVMPTAALVQNNDDRPLLVKVVADTHNHTDKVFDGQLADHRSLKLRDHRQLASAKRAPSWLRAWVQLHTLHLA
jgi:hypothetical protein